MHFDDIKIGMTVEISPAVIEKQKMLDFARKHRWKSRNITDFFTYHFHTHYNMAQKITIICIIV